eukprot:s10655_g3.t1
MWSLEPSCGGGGKLRGSQGDGLQGVRPRREVGGWGMLGGTAQTKATMPEAELGAAANKLIGQELAGGFNTQEDGKARKNGAIVCSRESPRQKGPNSVNGEDGGLGASLRGSAEQTADGLSASARAQAVLVGHASLLEVGSEMLREHAADETPQHIPTASARTRPFGLHA